MKSKEKGQCTSHTPHPEEVCPILSYPFSLLAVTLSTSRNLSAASSSLPWYLSAQSGSHISASLQLVSNDEQNIQSSQLSNIAFLQRLRVSPSFTACSLLTKRMLLLVTLESDSLPYASSYLEESQNFNFLLIPLINLSDLQFSHL